MPFPLPKPKPGMMMKPAGRPSFGQHSSQPPPMRNKPPFGKMMADGGSPMGSPTPIGGGGPAPAPPMQPGAQPGADADAGMEGVVKPEAVNYHDDAQNCQTCEYMGQDGTCAVLKMQVSPDGGCNAFEAKGGQGEGGEGDMMPGGEAGGTDDGSSGYQQ